MRRQVFALTALMASLGLWAFAMSGAAGTAFVLALSIACAAGLASSFKGLSVVPAMAWNIIAVPVFAMFVADYMFFSGDIVVSGSRLAGVLLGLKLFDLKRNRDYLLAYALVFFLLLAAAASTVSLAFFALIAVYVMALIWAMILFSTMSDMKAYGDERPGPSAIFGPRFMAVVAGLTLISLVTTLALFFIIPRMGIGIFQRKSATTLKVSGFSDTVDMGSLGEVKGDSTVVMRAEFPGGRPRGTVYFKGSTLVEYDGKSWTRDRAKSFIRRSGPEGFHIGPGQGRSTEFAILLEPLDTEVLFTVPNLFRLEGSFPAIWVESTGVIRLPSPPFTRVSYRGWTDLARVAADEAAPGGAPLDAYLETSAEGQRIKALSGEITTGAPGPLEKAEAIEQYLKANYRYTLSPKAGGGAGPLEDFLFYSKEGYCEHFATAMALMLRGSGVPSRLVTGFLEGEWNELGGYFMVRQQDAHSWVEAYLDGVGWTRFDPTPSAFAPVARPSSVALYLDLLRLRWNRYIIQFTSSDQRRAAMSAERRASELLLRIKAAFKDKRAPSLKEALPYAGAILAAVLAAILLMRARARSSGAKGPTYYREMLRALAGKGIRKDPFETPLEFARRVGDGRVMEITELFQAQRYGGTRAGRQDLERIRGYLRELRKG